MGRRLLHRIAPILLASLALSWAALGCGPADTDGSQAPSGTTAGGTAADTSADTPGSATTVQPTATQSTAPPATATEADLRVETVADGLEVPWEMRFLPGGELLVTERGGRVVRIGTESGTVSEIGVVDAASIGESGLLGMDLDPDYPEQPYVYLAYTYEGGGGLRLRLSRFTVDVAGTGDGLQDERIILDDLPAGRIHDGSRVAFGPEGHLWMTTGDSGRPDLAQDRGSLAGKVLRMTKDGSPAPGNPDPASPIFTLGHRNPQGLDFHPGTGRPFITEHGPDRGDEVNRLIAGDNYGWPAVTGPQGNGRFHDPIASWTPTIAPAGGVFYAPPDDPGTTVIPGWQGSFLFVTLKEADLRRLVPADADFTSVAAEEVLFDGEFGRLRAARVGPDGYLYIATSNRDGRGRPAPEDDRILRIGYVE